MAYQIRCNDSVLYDPRDDDLIVKSPKCKLGVNTVGEASFTILANHPHYGELAKLRSVFEVKQDGHAIFRGRMTDESKDFDNMKQVDLEGAMAYFNDSIVRPFAFPNAFLEDSEYISAASESAEQAAIDGGVVRFFLKMLIDNHNSQVQPFQRFKLGKVTVSDPNNYITREDTGYKKTWETLKEKLFESSLGGFLCIRYEDDGNYIDYLADFEHTSSQTIEFGENLLNIVQESDATETYSAIIPLGKQDENNSEALTIKGLPDGNITDDIVKKGDTLYSKSAVEKYGWIYAPVSETTWEDVADAENLQSKGVDYIEKTAMFFHDTVTVTAFDLHLADSEIEAFRIYSYINASSFPHFPKDHIKRFPLTELDIDIEDPQNTKITLGESKKALTDKTSTTANRVSVIEAKTNTAKKTIAEIEKKAADNEASISLLVQDGEANGELIISAINGETAAKILADRLDIEGKKLNIKVESTNIEGKLKANQISINDLSALNATIGGIKLSQIGMYCEAPPIETPISQADLNRGGTFKVVVEPNSNGMCVFTLELIDNNTGTTTYVEFIDEKGDTPYEREFSLDSVSVNNVEYRINYERDDAGSYSLYSVDYSNFGGWGLYNTSVPNDLVFYAGVDLNDKDEAPFRVYHSGKVHATTLYLEGEPFSFVYKAVEIRGNELRYILTEICKKIADIDSRLFMIGG